MIGVCTPDLSVHAQKKYSCVNTVRKKCVRLQSYPHPTHPTTTTIQIRFNLYIDEQERKKKEENLLRTEIDDNDAKLINAKSIRT